MGSSAAARDVRPDTGDSHLLRLRVRRQRSVRHQRTCAAGDALGARAELEQPAESYWVNERLTFTHGYGLTLGPVNQVTSEGLPVLYVRNLPTETIPELPITEPSLYFDELSNDYVIVRTRTREFHYPRGDENVFTQYSGQRRARARVAGSADHVRAAIWRLPNRVQRRHHR